MSDLFISYSRKDRAFVQQLYAALVEAKRDAWVDWEDIPPSAEWRAEIQAAIEAADAFLFVISPDSLKSRVCAEELSLAVSQNKRIIPLLHRDPAGEAVPETLSRLNYIYGRTQDPFDQVAQKLVQTLDTDLAHARAHTRLLVRAREWETRQRADSYLLRGEDLREAETWLAMGGAKEPHTTPLHAEYIASSRRAETIRQRRLLIGVAAALAVMTVLAALAVWQAGLATRREQARATQQAIAEANEQIANEREQARATQQAIAEANEQLANQREMARATQEAVAVQQAGLAQSGRLAALSQVELRGSSPELAVMLSLEALKRYPYTAQAEQSLVDAVQRTRLRRIFLGASEARWLPDGQRIVAAGQDGMVYVLDTRTGEAAGSFLSPAPVLDLQLASDGERVTITGQDGDQYILDIQTGQVVLTTTHLVDVEPSEFFPGHDISQWQPAGDRLASIAGSLLEKWVEIWDAESGTPLVKLISSAQGLNEDVAFLLVDGQDQIDELAWSPDGLRLATAHPLAGCCGMVSIWDPSSGERLQAWSTGYVDHLSWSPDGLRLATGDGYHDAPVRIWDAQTTLLSDSIGNVDVHISDLAWSPDGSAMAYVSSTENVLVVWDMGEGTERFSLEGPFKAVRWSPDSMHLLAEHADDTWLIDARPDFSLITLRGGKGAAWSPDGQRVITFSDVPRIYDIGQTLQKDPANDLLGSLPDAPAQEVPILENYTLSTWTAFDSIVARWLPGEQLAASDRSISSIWNLETGKAIPLPDDISNRFVVWSADGTRQARIGESIEIYNASGDFTFDLPNAREADFSYWDEFTPIAWDPDGTRIASQDGALIRLWDAATGHPVGTLVGHTEPVSDISWSPDNRRLTSTSGLYVVGSGGMLLYGDHTVRIWDVSSLTEMYQLLTPMDAIITSAQWSPDGKYLLTTNPIEDVTRIWRVWPDLDDLVEYAQQCCAVREFTPEELERFGLEQ